MKTRNIILLSTLIVNIQCGDSSAYRSKQMHGTYNGDKQRNNNDVEGSLKPNIPENRNLTAKNITYSNSRTDSNSNNSQSQRAHDRTFTSRNINPSIYHNSATVQTSPNSNQLASTSSSSQSSHIYTPNSNNIQNTNPQHTRANSSPQANMNYNIHSGTHAYNIYKSYTYPFVRYHKGISSDGVTCRIKCRGKNVYIPRSSRYVIHDNRLLQCDNYSFWSISEVPLFTPSSDVQTRSSERTRITNPFQGVIPARSNPQGHNSQSSTSVSSSNNRAIDNNQKKATESVPNNDTSEDTGFTIPLLNVDPRFSSLSNRRHNSKNNEKRPNIPATSASPQDNLPSNAHLDLPDLEVINKDDFDYQKTKIKLKSEQRKRVNKDQYISCQYCNKKFTSKYSYLMHEPLHKSEKPFVCDIPGCNRRFRQREQLTDHIRNTNHHKAKEGKNKDCSKKNEDKAV